MQGMELLAIGDKGRLDECSLTNPGIDGHYYEIDNSVRMLVMPPCGHACRRAVRWSAEGIASAWYESCHAMHT